MPNCWVCRNLAFLFNKEEALSFKKTISAIIVLSFLYSNCIYAIPENVIRHNTLTNVSELLSPEFRANIQNLAHVSNLLEKSRISENELSLFRVMFSKVLGADYEEVTVSYNKNLKELFLYSNKKDLIVHVYINGHTDLGEPIESPYDKVSVFKYTNERIDKINRVKDEEIKALPVLSVAEINDIAVEQIRSILKDAGIPFRENQTPEELVELYNANNDIKEFLRQLLAVTQSSVRSQSLPTAAISDLKETFHGQKGLSIDSTVYADAVAPLIEEYGLLFGLGIFVLFGAIGQDAGDNIVSRLWRDTKIPWYNKIFYFVGFRTVPIIVGLILVLKFVPMLTVAGIVMLLTMAFSIPFILNHKTWKSKLGATIVSLLILALYYVTPVLPTLGSCMVFIFGPYVMHNLWNRSVPSLYKAICDLMYAEREMRRKIEEEWRRKNRQPTAEEVADAVKDIEEKTEGLKEVLADIEESFLDEIKEDSGISTELDDEAIHNLREKIIKSAGDFVGKGGSSFDQWLSGLSSELQDVFLEDSPEAVAKLLASEKVKASLRKAYDFSVDNFLHHPPSQSGKGILGKVFHTFNDLLHASWHRRGMGDHHHDHHHPDGNGPTLKSIIWLVVGASALLYYMLTADNNGVMFAFAMGGITTLGGSEPKEPKPESVEKMTVDLREYVEENDVKDHYFSVNTASELENIVSRGKKVKTGGIIKNNALLVGNNSDITEYAVDSIVSHISSGKAGSDYPNLTETAHLLFNPAYLVDSLAIPGTIEDKIRELTSDLEEYYKEKGVILYINLQDLYDLGQMEGKGRTGDAMAGIYMRLAPLLESKTISLVCMGTNTLAKKFSQEARMMQYIEVIPLEETPDYRMAEIVRDELNGLNEFYKDILDGIKIKIKSQERDQLISRMNVLRTSQEPPKILKDKFENWFKTKFLLKNKLEWEFRYHTQQIEALLKKYKDETQRTELLDQYMHKWLEYHLNEINRIKKEIEAYEAWIGEIKKTGTYWLTADELMPKEAEWEEKVPDMESVLNSEVIDQEQAAQSIQHAFERAQVIHDKNHPIGSFIFVGPTGVGKTEVARALSRYLFGSDDQLVRIDGSEHGQMADMYKLIGPPPAIIGHEQGGTLTNEVSKRGFCIVLFDELEKAHATIQDLFLQVLDGARLTDGKGKTVDFHNVILIMTSNLGYGTAANKTDPEMVKKLREYITNTITQAKDDEIKTILERILEDYKRVNDKAQIFDKEIADINGLLEGGVVAEEGVISLAAFRLRKGTEADKTKSRRDYLKQYLEGIIANDLEGSIFDTSVLQGLYANLNYFEDTQPLTTGDEEKLSELLKKIGGQYTEYYRAMVLSAFTQGQAFDEEWVKQIQEIQSIQKKTLLEQRDYFLNRMRVEIEKNLKESIRNSFRREFLNKLGEDNIVMFSPLTKGALRQILKLKLKEVNRSLVKEGYGELSLTDELAEEVIKEGFRPDMGARPLVRALRRVVLEPLAEVMLKKELQPGRDITASLTDGKVMFLQDTTKTIPEANGVAIKTVLEQIKLDANFDMQEIFKTLGLSYAATEAKDQTQNEIDFKIQLPSETDAEDDVLKVDNAKLDEFETAIKGEIAELRAGLGQLETQLRTARENAQQQLLQGQINIIKTYIDLGEKKLRVITLKKAGKIDDARKEQDEIKQKKQSQNQKQEQEINDTFENLTIMAGEGEIEAKPTDPSIINSLYDTLKSSYRSDPFLIDSSFIVQRGIVEEAVRRIKEGDCAELEKTRFIRLKLTKMTSYLSLGGAFEGRMRDMMEAIHQDNLKKGIKTVIVMDMDEAQKEIERMRYNPFLLSFFLRIFHSYSDISFLMTSGDQSSTANEIFDRYFREVISKGVELDQLLESLIIASDSWLEDKNDKDNALQGLISFEMKQRALKIWRQFYTGEPPLETIKGWFKGIVTERKKKNRELQGRKNSLLQDIIRKIGNIRSDMEDDGETEWTVERLVGAKDLTALVKQLCDVDESLSDKADGKDQISKDELDREILKQEQARIAISKGEEIEIQSVDINPEERVLNLENTLNQKIFAQENTVKRIVTAVKINTAGLKTRNQPIGSFLFGGPTGVGKTEIAKQTAKAMGMRFFRIDLSEYKTREDVWKLIGAPRGYEGWDAGEGTFIDWIRKFPRTVILIDEVEKAHPDVLNILLQVLEDGIITSNRGRKVDFSESMIFLTSNLGVKEEVVMQDGKRQTVFDMYPEMEEVYKTEDQEKIDNFNKSMALRVNERISAFFRPELLNRLDAIEVFLPFKKESLIPIAKKLLNVRFMQLEAEHKIKVEMSLEDLEQAAIALVEKGFSPKSGAREIERLTETWVAQAFKPLLRTINNVPKDTKVICRWKEGKLYFEIDNANQMEQLPEQVSEKLQMLLSYLQSKKGEEVSVKDLRELFYPMEVKGKQTGNPASWTDNAVRKQVQGASPTKADSSIDEIKSEINNVLSGLDLAIDTEKEAFTELLLNEWLKETIGLGKRLNLWRYLWENSKKYIKNFWQMERVDIKKLFDECQKDGILEGKTVEVVYEKSDNGLLLGVKINSGLGRDLERVLVETQYESEDQIRQQLHNRKNLQGFLISLLKLKQSHLSARQAGVNVEYELNGDSTTVWVNIPFKVPAGKNETGLVSGSEDVTEVPSENKWAQISTIETEFMGFGRRYPGVALDKYTGDIYVPQMLGSDKTKTGFLNGKVIILDQNGASKGEILISDVSGVINDCFVTENYVLIATGSGLRVYNKTTRELDVTIGDNGILSRYTDFLTVVASEENERLSKIFAIANTGVLITYDPINKTGNNPSVGKCEAMWLSKSGDLILVTEGQSGIAVIDPNTFEMKYAFRGSEKFWINEIITDVYETEEGIIYCDGYSNVGKRRMFGFKRTDEEFEANWYDQKTRALQAIKAKKLVNIGTLDVPNENEPISLDYANGMIVGLSYGADKKTVAIFKKGKILNDKDANTTVNQILAGLMQLAARRMKTEGSRQVALKSGTSDLEEQAPAASMIFTNEQEVLNDIKTIMPRINNVLEFIWKTIKVQMDQAIQTDIRLRNADRRFAVAAAECAISLDIDELKNVCSVNMVPYQVIENFLKEGYKFQEDNGKLQITSRVSSILISFEMIRIRLSREIEKAENLEQAKEAISTSGILFPGLNPDGTPMQIKSIQENIGEGLNALSEKLGQYVQLLKFGKIKYNPSDTQRIGLRLFREARADAPGFLIEYLENDNDVVFHAIRFRNEVANAIKNKLKGNPFVNIGYAEDPKPRFVIVLKDDFFTEVIKDAEFKKFMNFKNSDLSYEVISESECNYRLTINPEFEKLFSWSEKNIATSGASQPEYAKTPKESYRRLQIQDGEKIGNGNLHMATDPESGILYIPAPNKKSVSIIQPNGSITELKLDYEPTACVVTSRHLFVSTFGDGVYVFKKDTLQLDTSFNAAGIPKNQGKIAYRASCSSVAVKEFEGKYEVFISTDNTIYKYTSLDFYTRPATNDSSPSWKFWKFDMAKKMIYDKQSDKLLVVERNKISILSPDTMMPEASTGEIPESEIKSLQSVVVDRNGFIYLAGEKSNKVLIYSIIPTDKEITVIYPEQDLNKRGTISYSVKALKKTGEIDLSNSGMEEPSTLCVDKDGNLLVGCWRTPGGNPAIWSISPTLNILTGDIDRALKVSPNPTMQDLVSFFKDTFISGEDPDVQILPEVEIVEMPEGEDVSVSFESSEDALLKIKIAQSMTDPAKALDIIISKMLIDPLIEMKYSEAIEVAYKKLSEWGKGPTLVEVIFLIQESFYSDPDKTTVVELTPEISFEDLENGKVIEIIRQGADIKIDIKINDPVIILRELIAEFSRQPLLAVQYSKMFQAASGLLEYWEKDAINKMQTSSRIRSIDEVVTEFLQYLSPDIEITDVLAQLKAFLSSPENQTKAIALLKEFDIEIGEDLDISDETIEGLWTLLATTENPEVNLALDVLEILNDRKSVISTFRPVNSTKPNTNPQMKLLGNINPVWRNNDHKGSVYVTVVSSDGRYLFSGSGDRTIKVWDISNPENPVLKSILDRTKQGHSNSVWALKMSQDGRYLFSGSEDDTIKVWDISNPENPLLKSTIDQTKQGHIKAILALTTSQDGRYLFSGSEDDTIKVWDISNPEDPVLKSTLDKTTQGLSDRILALTISQDGRYLFSGSEDDTIKVWDVSNPEIPVLKSTLDRNKQGHSNAVSALTISQDGRYLFSGGDTSIKVWDISNPEDPVLKSTLDQNILGHINVVLALAISQDGRYLFSGSADKTIKVWDISNSENPVLKLTLYQSEQGHDSIVRELAVSKDGRYLFSGSRYDQKKDNPTLISWKIAEVDVIRESDTARFEEDIDEGITPEWLIELLIAAIDFQTDADVKARIQKFIEAKPIIQRKQNTEDRTEETRNKDHSANEQILAEIKNIAGRLAETFKQINGIMETRQGEDDRRHPETGLLCIEIGMILNLEKIRQICAEQKIPYQIMEDFLKDVLTGWFIRDGELKIWGFNGLSISQQDTIKLFTDLETECRAIGKVTQIDDLKGFCRDYPKLFKLLGLNEDGTPWANLIAQIASSAMPVASSVTPEEEANFAKIKEIESRIYRVILDIENYIKQTRESSFSIDELKSSCALENIPYRVIEQFIVRNFPAWQKTNDGIFINLDPESCDGRWIAFLRKGRTALTALARMTAAQYSSFDMPPEYRELIADVLAAIESGETDANNESDGIKTPSGKTIKKIDITQNGQLICERDGNRYIFDAIGYNEQGPIKTGIILEITRDGQRPLAVIPMLDSVRVVYGLDGKAEKILYTESDGKKYTWDLKIDDVVYFETIAEPRPGQTVCARNGNQFIFNPSSYAPASMNVIRKFSKEREQIGDIFLELDTPIRIEYVKSENVYIPIRIYVIQGGKWVEWDLKSNEIFFEYEPDTDEEIEMLQEYAAKRNGSNRTDANTEQIQNLKRAFDALPWRQSDLTKEFRAGIYIRLDKNGDWVFNLSPVSDSIIQNTISGNPISLKYVSKNRSVVFGSNKIEVQQNPLKTFEWDRSKELLTIVFDDDFLRGLRLKAFAQTLSGYLEDSYEKESAWGDGYVESETRVNWRINYRIISESQYKEEKSKKPNAYFGEMTQDEINPQIKRILEDPKGKNFNFIRATSDETKIGNLVILREWEEKVMKVFDRLNMRHNGALNDYGVVVLKGVNFSGHYGINRRRIYIPYEILEMAEVFSKQSDNKRYYNFYDFVEDFIEHEYLHTQINPNTGNYYTEEQIAGISESRRPGLHKTAKEIYKKFIAIKLAQSMGDLKASGEAIESLKAKLEKILARVQEGKRIELTEIQMQRLLWLINQSKEFGLALEVSEIVNLMLEPNYAGNSSQVVMALEKEMLLWKYEQTRDVLDGRQSAFKEKIVEEKKKLLTVHKTHTFDLRFEGPELPEYVKKATVYINKYTVPQPVDVKKACYVLIDEFRAKEYEKIIDEVSKEWNVKFITKIPDGVSSKDVVVMIDPEDADREKWAGKGFEWFMPMVYNKKGFIFAAWLSITKPENIEENNTFFFVKHFYEQIFGKTLDPKEVAVWFKEPWLLKDRIVKVSEGLNLLRIALVQLDTAA
jgi:ATP-dependent Clp protease ATP-binding subunit ClpA